MAHMMHTWNFYCRNVNKDRKSRFAIQLQLNRKENNTKKSKRNQTERNEKEDKVDVRAKKQTQQRWVPSAPCRGRQHGREMDWIIIGHKSKIKNKTKTKQLLKSRGR